MGEQPYRVAAIIPTLSGKGEHLRAALQAQSRPPDEIHVIAGVRPNGKARNLGVAASTAEILLFIDDDAWPACPDLIERLVEPLLADEAIGVSGAARVLPPDASWFQRRVAAEIPRTVNRVPETPLETNPPLKGYGHSLITTTCCALRRSVYEEAAGFSENLTSGVDTDFFHRVRKLGYRFLMVPGVYVEHPAPASLGALWRKFTWYGRGYAQETVRRPEQGMGPRLPTRAHRAAFLVAASLWLLPNIFLLYSFSYPHLKLGFRPLKALSTYAVAWGYAQGWRDGIQ